MDLVWGSAYLLNAFENPYAFGGLIACSALLLSLLRRNYGFSFFLTMGLTFALTHIIKSIYKVARPEDALVVANGYRFPSMHASIAAALLTSLAWHWYERAPSRSVRIALLVGTPVLIVFIGWTRIILQVHEAIDVVAGIILGAGISLMLHYLMRRSNLE